VFPKLRQRPSALLVGWAAKDNLLPPVLVRAQPDLIASQALGLPLPATVPQARRLGARKSVAQLAGTAPKVQVLPCRHQRDITPRLKMTLRKNAKLNPSVNQARTVQVASPQSALPACTAMQLDFPCLLVLVLAPPVLSAPKDRQVQVPRLAQKAKLNLLTTFARRDQAQVRQFKVASTASPKIHLQNSVKVSSSAQQIRPVQTASEGLKSSL